MRLSTNGPRLWLYLSLVVLVLVLSVALAACASNGTDSGSANATASANATSGTGVGGTPNGSASTTPTLAASSPGAGQAGSAEYCSGPTNVQVKMPTSIPAYPNAQLHVSNVDPNNPENKFFTLCTKDAVSGVLSFYLAQLPAKGWQHIQHYTIAAVEELTASNSNGNALFTIQPDPVLANTTEIAIETVGIS